MTYNSTSVDASMFTGPLVLVRGFRGCLPRFDSRVSQWTLPATQFPQGCRSVTSHLTRLALQVTQANFARFFGGSDMLPNERVEMWDGKQSESAILFPSSCRRSNQARQPNST